MSIVPEVGMGATIVQDRDRYAVTIVDVLTVDTVVVQRDRAVRRDNNGRFSGKQEYDFLVKEGM